MTELIGTVIGILAMLTLRKRIGWASVLALMVLWGIAAGSSMTAFVRLWWKVVAWTSPSDPFQYGGPAWQTQQITWLPIAVLFLVAAAYYVIGWAERRNRS